MAGITQTIPNYVGGISEQPDQLKVPGQVKSVQNAIPDIVHGLYKRPGSKRIGPARITDVPSGGSWFHYYRDEVEGSYIGQIDSTGVPRIWSCNDGLAPKTVHYGAAPWVASTAYVVGDKVQNLGSIYVCDTDGTSASSGGPSGVGADITDGTTRWDYETSVNDETVAVKAYLTPSPSTDTEDIQALTINDTTFLNNRSKTVATTGTTTGRPHKNFAYIELARTENGRQYSLNIYDDNTTQTINVATRIKIDSDTLDEGNGTGICPGIGTQVFDISNPVLSVAVTAAGSGYTADPTVTFSGGGGSGATATATRESNTITGIVITHCGTGYTSAPTVTITGGNGSGATATATVGAGENLTFRLSSLGQQGVKEGATNIGGNDYRCSYNREVTLLHGGEGWDTDDTVTVTLDQAKTSYTYTVKVTDHEAAPITANVKAVRPAPTPFDADTSVTIDAILGGITSELSGVTVNGNALHSSLIGNGIYIYTDADADDFNVEVVDQDLMRVMQTTINDVTTLPFQCKNDLIVKVSNTRASDEDDYYVKFNGENDQDGAGSWIECAEPGIAKSFDASTMPHILQRLGDGSFVIKKYGWEDRLVGDNVTNSIPSFVGKSINKVLFFRNRLAFLSDENVILSRPGSIASPNFWSNTALTVSAIDPIDIACASNYPSPLYDAVEITSGLLCFSDNAQFLLASDDTIMNPDTAKLRAVSWYNYDKIIPPVSLGQTIGWVDNSNKYSRFVEIANVVREGEPIVQDTSKIVPTLIPKDIDLFTNSRENSLVFLGKTNSDTVIGYRYLRTGDKQLQSSWFKWKFNNPLKYHFIINDQYFFLDTDNFLQSVNLVEADTDPSITQSGVNYLLHLDNYSTISGGRYDATTQLTTFTHDDNGCRFDWHEDVTTPNGKLVLVDSNSNATRVGRYAECTVANNLRSFTVPGIWHQATLNIGYLYDYQVDFPRIYLQKASEDTVESDVNSKLTLHRMKLNFGKIGLYETTLTRVGKADYTEVYESTDLDEYNVSDAPYLDEEIKDIPIYEMNDNVDITLKSAHPAPATLRAMTWEGDWTPQHYRRV